MVTGWQRVPATPVPDASYSVQTAKNEDFGIEAGWSGTVHLFQAFARNQSVPDIPTAPESFGEYRNYFRTIVHGVTDGGLWPCLRDALGLADPKEPIAECTAGTGR